MITVQDVAKTLRNSFMTVRLAVNKMYFTQEIAKKKTRGRKVKSFYDEKLLWPKI